MAIVIFYEKPGCINNTLQKKLLREAGHRVVERNLLTTPWTASTLRRFFGDLPVAEWFNSSAPRIKSGDVVPDELSQTQALTMMLLDPLLIRRPLMQVGDVYRAGFDGDGVDGWIGLELKDVKQPQDLESCPRSHSESACSSGR
jgi:nitrogenase-associated protein